VSRRDRLREWIDASTPDYRDELTTQERRIAAAFWAASVCAAGMLALSSGILAGLAAGLLVGLWLGGAYYAATEYRHLRLIDHE